MDSLPFNPSPPTIIHIDLNSCFATIEQQANPYLRGKPIAVAAYTTPSGCILAPSIEAKRLGVKVGMRVKDGRVLCPQLIVLGPDPCKYRNVHLKLKQLLGTYTDKLVPKSIDEFFLDLKNCPALERGIWQTALEIKQRIKSQIGESIKVSIGIAPNRFLAKTAANLYKPDGLEEINKDNFLAVYSRLALTDLCGIKLKNQARLNSVGIYNLVDFYQAEFWRLKTAFQSILGYYWYLRLRGWQIDGVDFKRRSFGNSYALPQPFTSPKQLAPILSKLIEKSGRRLRRAGFKTQGIHLGLVYRDFTYWHRGKKIPRPLFDSREIYRQALKILTQAPFRKPVRELNVACFNLLPFGITQLEFFDDIDRKKRLVKAVDQVNERWGDFVIAPARMIGMDNIVLDRISFGNVDDLKYI